MLCIKQCQLLTPFFLFLCFSGTVPVGSPHAAQKTKYISQTVIDSSVQRAFYILTEAASTAGVGFRQKEAIEESKQIVRHLKQIAKGDPNERYILWKVGELEAQIYLEEKDLMLHQMQKGQISINQLIARYNTEVGKPRPDFASLKRIHSQMNNLDVNKANEIAGSYNKRYRAISREVLFSLEKSIVSGDLEKAREELGYCLRNKTYLTIPDSKYQNLENRVEGLTRARLYQPMIQNDIDQANKSLLQNRLAAAREKITSAENRYTEIKNFLPQNESGGLSSLINKASRLLNAKEDSLVNFTISLLHSKGVQAADDHLQKTLKPSGVCREKTAYVDKAILSINSPEDGRMSAEISELATTQENAQEAGFDAMLATAKKKAQIKMDSIRAIEEERLRKEQIEKMRRDSIIMHAEFEKQQKQNRAASISLELYSLLERNKTDAARNQFSKERSFLQKFMWKDAFEVLEMTVMQPSEPQIVETSVAISYIPANQEAAAEPKTQQSEKQKHNEEKAQQEIIEIYSMLESNQIEAAFRRFQKNRTPLQKYLEKEVFSMLESSVVQAHTYHISGNNR